MSVESVSGSGTLEGNFMGCASCGIRHVQVHLLMLDQTEIWGVLKSSAPAAPEQPQFGVAHCPAGGGRCPQEGPLLCGVSLHCNTITSVFFLFF